MELAQHRWLRRGARWGLHARVRGALCRGGAPPDIETFGGLGPELCAWLKRLAAERQNKLNKREYDDTTWAARSWRSYAAQQISVAVHRTVSMEIAQALGLSGAADERRDM